VGVLVGTEGDASTQKVNTTTLLLESLPSIGTTISASTIAAGGSVTVSAVTEPCSIDFAGERMGDTDGVQTTFEIECNETGMFQIDVYPRRRTHLPVSYSVEVT
jgi:hypothetical protein